MIFFNDSEQTTSRRLADRKIARFEKNITKRGSVPETVKKANDYPIGPILLGFFVFIVVGSCKSLIPYVSDALWLMVFLDTLSPLTVECICYLASYHICSEPSVLIFQSSSILSS
jgi:hypothetical protein